MRAWPLVFLVGCLPAFEPRESEDAQVDVEIDVGPPSCHHDCFGGAMCFGGVVTVWPRTPVPCEYWKGECPKTTFACPGSCAAASAAPFVDPATLCAPPIRTGLPCTSKADCASGTRCVLCSTELTAGDPDPVCHGCDACEVGQPCDGGRGFCTAPSRCEPLCEIDATGKLTRACVGSDACHPMVAGPGSVLGTCGGGCVRDVDCTKGSKYGICDPALRVCVHRLCGPEPCTGELFGVPTTCVLDWGTTGHCRVAFAKSDGEACQPGVGGAMSPECPCLGRDGGLAGSGLCATHCKTREVSSTGSDCAAGFVCDPLFAGAPGVPAKWPAGIAGRCLRPCTSDADCTVPGFTCVASTGMSAKTCHPPP